MNNKQEWLNCDMSEEIREGLIPLFETADENNLWFYCNYQDLWFSPEKLRHEQIEGRFRWGSVNWKLRNPSEKIKALEYAVIKAQEELAKAKLEITS